MAASAAMGTHENLFLKVQSGHFFFNFGGGGREVWSCLFTDKCSPQLLSHKAPHSGDPQILDMQRGGLPSRAGCHHLLLRELTSLFKVLPLSIWQPPLSYLAVQPPLTKRTFTVRKKESGYF